MEPVEEICKKKIEIVSKDEGFVDYGMPKTGHSG